MTEPLLPLLVEPEELVRHLGDSRLLIVDLSQRETFLQMHVPGAVNLPYARIIQKDPPAMGMLPDEETLSAVLSGIGLTPENHVVAYDDEGNGRASRLLWTLDALGHEGLSLLNGGLHSWAEEDHPLEAGDVEPTPSKYQAKIRNDEVLADRDYVLQHLGDEGVAILDARSPAEYRGEDVRAQRGGHIPGAVNLEWLQTMDRGRNLRFLPDDKLQAMLADLGITPDKEVITHCQTHHRSAHTYIMLKHLGFERVRGYAGSWSEWGNDEDLPVETD
ncbi:sulfurtransferase [Ectothiorhodospiraceae bacterium WFHF3C12]|nr:sulfurtransferase [Ectothiorhodospiraceae bacterium WFHF3C12]